MTAAKNSLPPKYGKRVGLKFGVFKPLRFDQRYLIRTIFELPG
jgi:hypothetical protein